jgi:hypothetical protein
VTVPVAASRAALTTPRLAALMALGDEWGAELLESQHRHEQGHCDDIPTCAEDRAGAVDGAGAHDTSGNRTGETDTLTIAGGGDGQWEGGVSSPAVGVSLALIDTDATMVGTPWITSH